MFSPIPILGSLKEIFIAIESVPSTVKGTQTTPKKFVRLLPALASLELQVYYPPQARSLTGPPPTRGMRCLERPGTIFGWMTAQGPGSRSGIRHLMLAVRLALGSARSDRALRLDSVQVNGGSRLGTTLGMGRGVAPCHSRSEDVRRLHCESENLSLTFSAESRCDKNCHQPKISFAGLSRFPWRPLRLCASHSANRCDKNVMNPKFQISLVRFQIDWVRFSMTDARSLGLAFAL